MEQIKIPTQPPHQDPALAPAAAEIATAACPPWCAGADDHDVWDDGDVTCTTHTHTYAVGHGRRGGGGEFRATLDRTDRQSDVSPEPVYIRLADVYTGTFGRPQHDSMQDDMTPADAHSLAVLLLDASAHALVTVAERDPRDTREGWHPYDAEGECRAGWCLSAWDPVCRKWLGWHRHDVTTVHAEDDELVQVSIARDDDWRPRGECVLMTATTEVDGLDCDPRRIPLTSGQAREIGFALLRSAAELELRDELHGVES